MKLKLMAKHTKASSFLYIRIVVLKCVDVYRFVQILILTYDVEKTFLLEVWYESCINTCLWLACLSSGEMFLAYSSKYCMFNR